MGSALSTTPDDHSCNIGLSVGVYVRPVHDFPEFKVEDEATGATMEASVEGGVEERHGDAARKLPFPEFEVESEATGPLWRTPMGHSRPVRTQARPNAPQLGGCCRICE